MAQCIDNTEYLDNRRPILDDNKFDENVISEAYIRWKLAKNHCWPIVRSWIAKDAEVFGFEVALNANKSEERYLKFKDVCEEFNWESFTLENFDQRIRFKMKENYVEEIEKIIRKANRNSKKVEAESKYEFRKNGLMNDNYSGLFSKKTKRK